MKTKKTTLILILLMAGLFLTNHEIFPQQTASQLYEKALYLEEARGELQGAIDIYNQLAENPDAAQSLKAKALLHMGLCYEKLGSEKARQAYRDVINRYPEQAEEAAIARERMTSLDAYVAELNTKAEQHMKQGNELFKMWEYDDAIKEYEDAITLRPNTLLAMNAQYSIGHSLYRAGEYEDAMATFTNLIEENPESNIAPVTELMLYQVQHAMENDENPGRARSYSDENKIVDPETGIAYKKIKTFTEKMTR
jgi:TolA-binding protein